MTTPIRIGFIGCGQHALRAHAKALLAIPNYFHLVDTYDQNIEAARALYTLVNNAPYQGTAMCAGDLTRNKDIEAILICTPHDTHLEFMESSVKAGKHVFCEKPVWALGQSADQVAYVLELAKEKGLIVSSCHPRRYMREYVELAHHVPILKALHGPITEFRYNFYYHEPSTEWKKSDNLLLDHMNHELDLVHFLIGYAPTILTEISSSFDEYRVTGERNDSVALSFYGQRRLTTHTFLNELVLTFTTGRVTVSSRLENGFVHTRTVEENFESGGAQIETYVTDPLYPFVGIMRNFAKAIRGTEPSYLSYKDLLINTGACHSLINDKFAAV